MNDAEIKRQLADISEELYHNGVVTATGGNLSVRSCERECALWITPSALFKGNLTPGDMTLIDLDGKVLAGKYPPSIEFAFHAGLMRSRPDVNAIVHSHPVYATVWGLGDLDIPPITYDALIVGSFPYIPWHMVGSLELASAVIDSAGRDGIWGVFMRNHGLVTLGRELRQAADNTLMTEHTLKILHLAHQMSIKPDEL
ncbi:MAG: class II aldolase/adducin family protein, partial [Anaerolineaceae bacterium]|nr:class II aldolase/adducin family protein [Anaerolineaceae bacterium]